MPPSRTDQRTVLITGCSKHGLGHALAIAFHNAGLRVFATARDPSRMAGLPEMGIECLQMDVCDQDSIGGCVERVRELTREEAGGEGRLDCLVNNAGGGKFLLRPFGFLVLYLFFAPLPLRLV